MARPGLAPGTPRFSVVRCRHSNDGEFPASSPDPGGGLRRSGACKLRSVLADSGDEPRLISQWARLVHDAISAAGWDVRGGGRPHPRREQTDRGEAEDAAAPVAVSVGRARPSRSAGSVCAVSGSLEIHGLQQCGAVIDADDGAALDERRAERARSTAGIEHPAPGCVANEAQHGRALVVRVPRIALVVPRIACRERVVVGIGTHRVTAAPVVLLRRGRSLKRSPVMGGSGVPLPVRR